MPFELLCTRTRGSSHIKNDTPCEDFGGVKAGEFYDVFAVADGHGDSNCPRSSLGSKLACDIAIAELSEFAETARATTNERSGGEGEVGLWEDQLLDVEARGRLMRQLITSIIGKWADAVHLDYSDNPLSDEERAGCNEYIEQYDKGDRIEHIYGTTLICGLATDRYLLLIQQGDGRCDVFYGDGSVDQPIPWDDKCFANITTSLCDTDAIQRCRYSVIDRSEADVVACLAGSDGVEDSFFSMDQMHSYYRDILCDIAANGIEQAEKKLDEELPAFSQAGSNDDVTICGIIDTERISLLADAYAAENRAVELTSKLSQIDDRLSSMGAGKLDYLRAKYESRQSKRIDIQSQIEALQREYDLYSHDAESVTATDDADAESSTKGLLALLSQGAIGLLRTSLMAKMDAIESQLSSLRAALAKHDEESGPADDEYKAYLQTFEDLEQARTDCLEDIRALRGQQ